jgi:hypothetical protein
MGRRVVLALVAAGLLLSTRAARAEPETSRATGPHFEVIAHFRGPAVAREALEAAEAAWEPAVGLFGAPAPRPPMAVHLYRTEAAYHEADRALSGGAFRKNLAFAHHATSSAHVAVQPDMSDATLRDLGLSAQTKRLLVHEATHLIRFAAMPEFTKHPGWFRDGAALWVADRVARTKGWSPGLEEDPHTSTWIHLARREADRLGEDALERLLVDDVADVEMYARYSLRGLTFSWLAEKPRRADLDRFLALVRAAGGSPDVATRFSEAVRATLLPEGESGRARCSSWRAWLDGLRPEWEEVHRSLEARGEDLVQVAFPNHNAIAWRPAELAPPYVLEADVEVLAGVGRQMNVLFARRGNDFLSVALVADQGVTLLRYRSAEDRWDTLAHANAPGFRLGWRSRVVVAAADDVAVSIDGVELLRHPATGLDLTGASGLGAQAGTAGIWARTRIR